MTQYSNGHWANLLAHMLKTPSILKQASATLRGDYFRAQGVGGSYGQSILFDVIKSYSDRFGIAPDRATILTEVSAIAARYWQQGSPDYNAVMIETDYFLSSYILGVTDAALPLVKETMAWMTKTCYHDPQATLMMQEALSTGELDGLGAKLTTLSREVQSSQNSLLITDLTVAPTASGARFRTGIPFLDSRFGSGAGPTSGCCMGIVAPQGCGKTLLGVQGCVAQALMQQHALLILLEIGLTAAIYRRIMSAATCIPMPLLEKHGDNVKAAAAEAGFNLDAIDAKVAAIHKYLTLVDLANNPGGLETIEQSIDEAITRGRKPVVTYIDWAGLIAERMLGEGYRGQKFITKESAMKRASYVLAGKAVQTNHFIIVSQQMSTKAVARGPAGTHDTYAAEDCHGFSQPFGYSLTINPLHVETGLQLCQVVKARDDVRPTPFLLKMHGEIAQFSEAVTHEMRGKRIVKKNAVDGAHTIPVEKPKAPRC
jgi:hypothetical protein